jgi:hypothetical protein
VGQGKITALGLTTPYMMMMMIIIIIMIIMIMIMSMMITLFPLYVSARTTWTR